MSVLKAKRTESKLMVIVKARELCTYTIKICKNEKHFPKRDRWILTQPIVSEALTIFRNTRKANAVNVETADDYLYRRRQQVEAYSCCESLLSLIELAYTTLGLESERVEYWTGLVLEVETLLAKWKSRDKERYQAFLHNDIQSEGD